MQRLVLTVFLIISPVAASADILHIVDSGFLPVIHSTSPLGSGLSSTDYNVVFNYTAIPGNSWDFGFAFVRSSATFTWYVDVTAEIDTRVAGHAHAPQARLYYYPDWPDRTRVARFDNVTVRSSELAQDQSFTVHVAPVDYAAKLTVRGKYTKYYYGSILHPVLTHYLTMKTPGIEQLPEDAGLYKLAAGTASHPKSGYASGATVDTLRKLAAAWRDGYPGTPLIEITRASLPWGGAFDVNNDWRADNMHHAYGIAVDISKNGYNSGERAALTDLMCKSGFYVYNRTEGGTEGYHIVQKAEFSTLRKLGWPVKLPTRREGAADCCAAKPGSADYLKCVGNGGK